MDPVVNEAIIEYFRKRFGALTVTRGKKHTFIRMNITIREDKNIDIEIMGQVKDAITSFGEILSVTVS